jgi:antitoxin (DNA-binding transcriptional repressor) of toxin-antitoxin stability system
VQRLLAGLTSPDSGQIIIAKAGKPVAKLVPYQEEMQPRIPGGRWKGKIWMSKDFDELPAEIAAAFRGESE